MAVIEGHHIKLFSLSANPQLAEEISKETGIPLSKIELDRFADGEIGINIPETVRGHHVFLVQPTNEPVNENIMELLITIDAMKRASAKNINVIMPYYGYSRQDRKSKSRQPISAKLFANLLETAGATRVLSMDLHAGQIQGFFDIPIDNFRALPIIVRYFESKKFTDDIVIVAPDHGGAVRARKMGDIMNCPIAIIDKRRPEPNVAEVMGIVGDVQGKVAILIDDIIDTAGTITAAARALIKQGAKEVYAACTHPLFSPPAVERINDSPIQELICTNTIMLPEYKKSEKIVQLSIGPLLGKGVMSIIHDDSLSKLFEYDAITGEGK
ncbi:ribose-phosphate diphosphokinase [Candidatus Xianfuyuplasma coldseepsis]|uniref:Ribose-phosphate pyrophosphokinase n=1 Tax=Candidatus Xianfuyuplasma coldseepsis TaxID=2782163 RepID=A0A7L7KQG7_9MOLU|nr:ribose-phosphate pyrophosphokinase [Xianfuyuplasma coldseepsis]QMS84963.1 ribose-phosphate pyrophosphokinase [Xianfuyuplasma coldseepsis]